MFNFNHERRREEIFKKINNKFLKKFRARKYENFEIKNKKIIFLKERR
jgi:hypothetical protein